MNPGRFEEQPMPLIVTTWCGFNPSSNSAVCSADSTEKSPQPGHQSGWILPLNVSLINAAAARGAGGGFDGCAHGYGSWLDVDFVLGNGKLRDLPASCSFTALTM